MPLGTSEPDETPEKKKGFKWVVTAILVPALCWALADAAGEFFADLTVSQLKTNQSVSEIVERAAQLPAYVPGTCTDAGYVSEYLDLSFRADAHWQMGSEEDKQETADAMASEYKDAFLQSAISEGIPAEVANAMVENGHAEGEFCAWYFDDEGVYQGAAMMYVTNYFHLSADADSIDVDSILEGTLSGDENATATEVAILGTAYTAAILPISDDLNGAMVYYPTDNSTCGFAIYYSDGHEEVVTAFFEQIGTAEQFLSAAEENLQNQTAAASAEDSAFVPGICTDAGYVSEYLNLKFNTNERWQLDTPEEAAYMSSDLVSALPELVYEYLVSQNIDPETADALIKHSYTGCEFAALCYDNDGAMRGYGFMVVTDCCANAGLPAEMLTGFTSFDGAESESTLTDVTFLGATQQLGIFSTTEEVYTGYSSAFIDDNYCLFVLFYIGSEDSAEDTFVSFFDQFSTIN